MLHGDEEVWVTYCIPANPEWYEEGYVENWLCLEAYDEGDGYKNLVLPEGTEISTEEGGLILTPSEQIYSQEYSEYYDYYYDSGY